MRTGYAVLYRNKGYVEAAKDLREMIGFPVMSGSGDEWEMSNLWTTRLNSQQQNRNDAAKNTERKAARVEGA
ncbi:hypothetical protein HDU77_011826 [Chytriomyces hyalinus]|nr:hypothetical protein HDU77_011826 [Chytriomyces hyalinus]